MGVGIIMIDTDLGTEETEATGETGGTGETGEGKERIGGFGAPDAITTVIYVTIAAVRLERRSSLLYRTTADCTYSRDDLKLPIRTLIISESLSLGIDIPLLY